VIILGVIFLGVIFRPNRLPVKQFAVDTEVMRDRWI
jgi:hypothetical protein